MVDYFVVKWAITHPLVPIFHPDEDETSQIDETEKEK